MSTLGSGTTSGAVAVKASGSRTSVPPYRTATSTGPGSSAGTTTDSDARSPAPDCTRETGSPPTLTTPSRSTSARSKYTSASSIPITSPGFAVPSPPVSTPAIR
ncbi:hypothetical protein [Streptomyces coerulescens]|uniref:Uncharacterized protein n=1 Tax=Streptomyces coerulescens TaxID=29304 RepID=A0ABW0CK05_STRCD